MSFRQTAIVIGSGIAGLMAARALSHHFARVTVIDRDELPDDHAWRNGVPQAHHTHVLLNRGASIMERYLPGLRDELAAAGAPSFNFGTDMKFRTYYGWAVRPFGDLPGRRCTRSLLELCVRKKVRERGNIEFLPKTPAKGLLTSNEAVVGVNTAHGDLQANFVVEASGKASKFDEWITGLGYTFPKAAVIDGIVGYGTQFFKASPEHTRDWKGIIVQPAPDRPGGTRGGSLLPIENGQWSVTLSGYGGDYPPVEAAAFLEYARGFRVPDLYNALKDAEPVGRVFGSRSTENRHLHLERMKKWPKGFVVTGDAAIHLNPVYAQGMTLASIEAEALDRSLASGDDGLEHRFFSEINRVTQDAWMLATSVDLRVPNREGDAPPPGFALACRYNDQLMKVVCHHRTSACRFAEVIHLLRAPTSLMAPNILVRALLADVMNGKMRQPNGQPANA